MGHSTDGAGRFKIGGLASGPCTLWARKGLLASEPQTVEVRANGTTQAELSACPGTLVQVQIHTKWKSLGWWAWRGIASALDIGLL